MAEDYIFITVLNQFIAGLRFKDLKRAEKIGIAASIGLGIDAILTPMFTGGKPLHQIVLESAGLPLSSSMEYSITLAEESFALAGVVYQTIRNGIYILRNQCGYGHSLGHHMSQNTQSYGITTKH